MPGLKQFTGNAAATKLNGQLAQATTTTFTVQTGGGTNYPTGGVNGNFVVVIDRGNSLEEKILCSARSGDTFTIAASGRGYDGTSAATHADQAVVEHVVDADTLTEVNAHVNTTSRDDHTQYLNTTRHTPSLAGHVVHTAHTFVVSGVIAVPSGQVDYINPFFVSVPAGRTLKLIKARHRLNSAAGNTVTAKLQINGSDATGFTGLTVSATSTLTDPTDITLADGDLISLVVTAVSGTPQNMSFTCFLELS